METIQVVLDKKLLLAADRAARRLKANRSALRPPVSEVTLPILIHAIIRRVILMDDDCWWRWWCVRLNDNADAGADVRLIGEFSA